MHDQVQAALEVVEDGDFLGEHQQDVGRAELVALVPLCQPRLDIADRLEAEIADQATGEIRQLRQPWHVVLQAQPFDLAQRIVQVTPFDDLSGIPRSSSSWPRRRYTRRAGRPMIE